MLIVDTIEETKESTFFAEAFVVTMIDNGGYATDYHAILPDYKRSALCVLIKRVSAKSN